MENFKKNYEIDLPKNKCDRVSLANTETDSYTLSVLSKDEYYRVRLGVANNENTSSDTLIELSKDTNVRIRVTVVKNKNTPICVLFEALNDNSPSVRYWACRVILGYIEDNSIDAKALSLFANHEDADIRCRVAGNPNTPPYILEQLSFDKKNAIKLAVAKNRATPIKTLIDFFDYYDYDVRQAALQTVHELIYSASTEEIVQYADSSNPKIQAIVAGSPNTPEAILEELSFSNNPSIRELVAYNESTSEEVLERLAGDKSDKIRWKVTINEKTSFPVLYQLTKDRKSAIAEQAIYQIETRILKMNEIELSELIENYSEDYIYRAIAKNNSAPSELLCELSGSMDAITRKKVAQNPNVSIFTLIELSADNDKSIVVEAEQQISNRIKNYNTDELSELMTCADNVSIQREIAKSPKASKIILKELSDSPDTITRKNVAQNPNTSILTLGKLSEDNDYFIILEAERQISKRIKNIDVDELSELMTDVDYVSIQREIAKSSKASEEILEKLSKSMDTITRKNVAQNPNTSISTLLPLTRDSDSFILSDAKDHIYDIVQNSDINKLYELSYVDDVFIQECVAMNPNTPQNILAKFAKIDDKNVRFALCHNENTPESAINSICKEIFSTDVNERLKLVVNPGASQKVLKTITENDGHVLVILFAAFNKECSSTWFKNNPNIPVNLVDEIISNRQWFFERHNKHFFVDPLINIAKDNTAPPKILELLAMTQLSEFLEIIADNTNTPERVLISLYEYKNEKINIGLARNPKTPPFILSNFVENGSLYTKKLAISNPNTPSDVLIKYYNEYEDGIWKQYYLATNPNLPMELLIELSKDENIYVRCGVAGNPSTPIDILIAYAKDSDCMLRRKVANNSHTPIDVLKELQNDEDRYVRQHAKKQIRLICDEIILRDLIDKGLLDKDKYINEKLSVLKMASNPDTPSEVLSYLYKQTDSSIRLMIAKNASTPIDVLVELLCDEDNKVCNAAKKTIKSMIDKNDSDILNHLLKTKNDNVKIILASQYSTPTDILVALSKDENMRIRQVANKNLRMR